MVESGTAPAIELVTRLRELVATRVNAPVSDDAAVVNVLLREAADEIEAGEARVVAMNHDADQWQQEATRRALKLKASADRNTRLTQALREIKSMSSGGLPGSGYHDIACFVDAVLSSVPEGKD